MTLEQFFKENPSVALGFSGGVDSAFLLYAAVKYGADVHAYYVNTQFQPAFELDDAKKIAEQLGAKMTVIDMDALEKEIVASNPIDRCYHCKKRIFQNIQKQALADGYHTIIDGNNASDDTADRPGMRAVKELKVLSPLRQCGLTKDKIRELSKEANLFTHNKPAYACLATRIPTGTRITAEMLSKIEVSEDIMRKLGFTDFRVRVVGDTAKIQLPENQMKMMIEKREEIVNQINKSFENIVLDLVPR